MKEEKWQQPEPVQQDMLRVLQAEKDAEQTVSHCEYEARQLINEAQISARNINIRNDQRISNMEMRHSHKLNHQINDIEKQGAIELDTDAEHHYDMDMLQRVVEELARQLCWNRTQTEDKKEGGK